MTVKKTFIAAAVTMMCLNGCGTVSSPTSNIHKNDESLSVTTTSVPTTELTAVTTIRTTAKTSTTEKMQTTETSANTAYNAEEKSEFSEKESAVKVNSESSSSDMQESTEALRQLSVTSAKADKIAETATVGTEAVIHSDSAMYDENDNEIPTSSPKAEPVVTQGDGNVTLIGTLQEQMGKEPLQVSKEESEMLVGMLNEIELQPVDSPDRASIPYGGGYIMNIEGGERYILIGGRYLQIGDKYYYDANNKSDVLSATIGSIIYSYYGEP